MPAFPAWITWISIPCWPTKNSWSARRPANSSMSPAPLIVKHNREVHIPSGPGAANWLNLGFFGANLEGYGCAGMSNVAYGLVMQELERGDSGLRSFVSVQSALVMYPIHEYGSPTQKDKWLPRMQSGKALGCFGLTERNSAPIPPACSREPHAAAIATS